MASSRASDSVFQAAPFIPADANFALTAQYNLDQSSSKVNLGQGTYRDESGQSWTLPSVAMSREKIAKEGLFHEYLPILGTTKFRNGVAKLVMGEDRYNARANRKLSIYFRNRCFAPSWSAPQKIQRPNTRHLHQRTHLVQPHAVFDSLGFNCLAYRYYDPLTQALDFESVIDTLNSAKAGSIVILHACAHNPTGCDPGPEQWRQIGELMMRKKLFPLFDAAYLGFNSGNIDKDAFAIRHFVNTLELEAIVCVSFAKNMGLYGMIPIALWIRTESPADNHTTSGERVGCVLLATASETAAKNSQSCLESLTRSEISNPPAYGAKIATKILEDEDLLAQWHEDLLTMSSRILGMRRALYDALSKLCKRFLIDSNECLLIYPRGVGLVACNSTIRNVRVPWPDS
ncbi:aromatic-amino-acid aminotransferase [Aureobasidium subglaciale]|nr:aromatic-amino-acid aminotransferase [Aureobasidium subglaciale]KAI5214599.1 aromatic-amino-acid aminotransferase [Aureobasidium subglaciale]KAI5217386.1 aromatic-amino-acid aminotransferase [Aureobasidium subglaciale]KAI5255050.1 aromatic-amino-acid aminotransferase [Aureobasidium subglaciale]